MCIGDYTRPAVDATWMTNRCAAGTHPEIRPGCRPHSPVLEEPPNGPLDHPMQKAQVLRPATSQYAKWCHWKPPGLRATGGVQGAAPCWGEGMGRQAVGGQPRLRSAFSASVVPSSPHLSRLQPYLPPTSSHLGQPLLALGFITSITPLVRQATHMQKDRQN